MADYKTKFIGSPNFTPGNQTLNAYGERRKVKKLIIHWMAGTLAGTDAVFQNTRRQTSAHYGLEDDKRHQYVLEKDTAWHAKQANPFSIGIENSAQPGREASKATYANLVQLAASLCKKYDLDPDSDIEPHRQYVVTTCPGTMDLNYIKRAVKAQLKGKPAPSRQPQEKHPVPPKVTTAKQLYLPAAATSWRVYPIGKAPRVGNEVGYLAPSRYGGLTYDILGNPQRNVYTIKTRDFGRVNIYAAPSTGASIIGSNGVADDSPGIADIRPTVYFPPHRGNWNVYPLPKRPVIGNEIGEINPTLFNGLTYDILARPMRNVVTIRTRDFGKVNVYVAPATGAITK